MQRWMCGALVALAALVSVWPAAARADDDGRLVVIQQRKFRLTHELELGAMFEPQDAFTKGLAAEAGYTWHMTDSLGWEVLRAGYLKQFDTNLRTQLLRDFGVSPTAFDSLQYYASTALLWAPFYGKLARGNGSVTHIDAFLTGGVAAGRFTSFFAGGPEVGVGFRVYFNKTLSLRVEARDAYFIARKSENVVFLSAGLGISLGGSD